MVLKRLKKLSQANVETNTLEKINAFLEDKYNAPVPYKQKPGHSPSTVGTKCFRKIYYSYWKVAKDRGLDARACRIFWTGDSYEAMVVAWLKGIGEHIPYRNKSNGEIPKNRRTGLPDPQFPIKSEKYRIRKGMIDNVAITNKELWMYEIKSSKADKWKKLTQPEDAHLTQASIYFTCFNELLAEGEYKHIKELEKMTQAIGIRYLYINKDTSEIKQFDIKDANLVKLKQINDAKFIKANEYIDAKTLPPKTPDYCFFCSFRRKCENDWNMLTDDTNN